MARTGHPVARKNYLARDQLSILCHKIATTVDRSIEDVASWPGVTVGEHRFGGTEWLVGPREIGQVHA